MVLPEGSSNQDDDPRPGKDVSVYQKFLVVKEAGDGVEKQVKSKYELKAQGSKLKAVRVESNKS